MAALGSIDVLLTNDCGLKFWITNQEPLNKAPDEHVIDAATYCYSFFPVSGPILFGQATEFSTSAGLGSASL